MAAVASSSSGSHHSKINIGGLDHHHKFMVSGHIPGAIPNHEVARAIGGMGLPLVVTGRSEGGDRGGENGGCKRARKRTYSQTNQDMQGMHNLYRAILKGCNFNSELLLKMELNNRAQHKNAIRLPFLLALVYCHIPLSINAWF